VLSFAVVIGGGWALYTFASLRQVEIAKTEVEQMRRNLLQRGKLDITMQHSEIGRTADATSLLLVNITIHNDGNRSEVIDWRKSGMKVTPVKLGKNGNLAYGITEDIKYVHPIAGQALISTSILPGQTQTLPFLLAIESSGLYFLAFQAEVSPSERDANAAEHKTIGVTPERLVWETSTYVFIEENS
jgi:hypothetical protein